MHPKMEKYLLRKAFDRPESPYLPEDVLWRQKEQFSDGVGYDWVDRLRDYSHEVCKSAQLQLPFLFVTMLHMKGGCDMDRLAAHCSHAMSMLLCLHA